MSLFEYLMVMVSIILGLGATQLLRGFSKIAQSSSRFHLLNIWAGILFWVYLQTWWAYWDMHKVLIWNQFHFYLLLAGPCALFAATEILMPSSLTANTDWRAHFFKVQKWFFGIFFGFAVIAAISTFILLEFPLTHPYRAVQGTALILILAGYFTRSDNVQLWLSVAFLCNIVIGQALFRFLPGLAQ